MGKIHNRKNHLNTRLTSEGKTFFWGGNIISAGLHIFYNNSHTSKSNLKNMQRIRILQHKGKGQLPYVDG